MTGLHRHTQVERCTDMHTLTPGDGDYYYRLDEHPTNPDAAAISTCQLPLAARLCSAFPQAERVCHTAGTHGIPG